MGTAGVYPIHLFVHVSRKPLRICRGETEKLVENIVVDVCSNHVVVVIRRAKQVGCIYLLMLPDNAGLSRNQREKDASTAAQPKSRSYLSERSPRLRAFSLAPALGFFAYRP